MDYVKDWWYYPMIIVLAGLLLDYIYYKINWDPTYIPFWGELDLRALLVMFAIILSTIMLAIGVVIGQLI